MGTWKGRNGGWELGEEEFVLIFVFVFVFVSIFAEGWGPKGPPSPMQIEGMRYGGVF